MANDGPVNPEQSQINLEKIMGRFTPKEPKMASLINSHEVGVLGGLWLQKPSPHERFLLSSYAWVAEKQENEEPLTNNEMKNLAEAIKWISQLDKEQFFWKEVLKRETAPLFLEDKWKDHLKVIAKKITEDGFLTGINPHNRLRQMLDPYVSELEIKKILVSDKEKVSNS